MESNRKTIWMIYPYGPVHGDKGKACRYTQFGMKLGKEGYSVIWWTSNFSHGEKVFRSKNWKDIQVSENFVTKLVPTVAYKKNISIRRIISELKFSRNLKKMFSTLEPPNLIITAGTGVFNAFHPCWPYAFENKIPIIYDIMDISLIDSYLDEHFKIFTPITKALMENVRKREEGFFKNIDGICALGKNQLEYAKMRAYNREIPSCLVYNGIEVDNLRKLEISDEGETLVPKKEKEWIWCIFAGSLGPSYDIDTIVKCAKICEKKEERILFLIAGSGPQSTYVKNASNECKNILYLGQIELSTLFSIYRHCDIGLCAFSSYSTVDMPDKFYDYCAAGLATVNSLHGEVYEYILRNELGTNYVAGDPISLLTSINEIIADKLDRCKKNAYRIGGNFDILIQVEKLSDMIKTIVN